MKDVKNLGHIFIEAFQGINNDGSSKRFLAIFFGLVIMGIMCLTYDITWAWCVSRDHPTDLQNNIGNSWLYMVAQNFAFIVSCLGLTTFEKTINPQPASEKTDNVQN